MDIYGKRPEFLSKTDKMILNFVCFNMIQVTKLYMIQVTISNAYIIMPFSCFLLLASCFLLRNNKRERGALSAPLSILLSFP